MVAGAVRPFQAGVLNKYSITVLFRFRYDEAWKDSVCDVNDLQTPSTTPIILLITIIHLLPSRPCWQAVVVAS